MLRIQSNLNGFLLLVLDFGCANGLEEGAGRDPDPGTIGSNSLSALGPMLGCQLR